MNTEEKEDEDGRECSACGFPDPVGGLMEIKKSYSSTLPHNVHVCTMCANHTGKWLIYGGSHCENGSLAKAIGFGVNMILKKLEEMK